MLKRIICLILSLCFFFCGCSSKPDTYEEVKDEIISITNSYIQGEISNDEAYGKLENIKMPAVDGESSTTELLTQLMVIFEGLNNDDKEVVAECVENILDIEF